MNSKINNVRTRSKRWWHLLLIQWSRIKSNKSEHKIKKCWGTYKINSKSNNKNKLVENVRLKNRRKEWKSILINKSNKNVWNSNLTKWLTKNKQKCGKRIHKISSKTKKRSNNIWKISINNMNRYWRNKLLRRKRKIIKRKWILWNYYIIKL